MFTFCCSVMYRILVDEEDGVGYENTLLELEDSRKGVIL
jgi:hypothetical protein